jgi:hypothetical protein
MSIGILYPTKTIPKSALFKRSEKTMKTSGIPAKAVILPHSSKLAEDISNLKSKDCHCLSCSNTKKAYGAKLLCTVKNKLVSQYNICTYWGKEIVK